MAAAAVADRGELHPLGKVPGRDGMDHDVGRRGFGQFEDRDVVVRTFRVEALELGIAVNRLHRDALGGIAARVEDELHVRRVAACNVPGGQHVSPGDQNPGVRGCP